MSNLQTAVNNSLTRVGHSRIKLPDSFVAEGILRIGAHTQGDYWTYIQRSTRGTEGSRATTAGLAAAPILRTTVANRGAVECAAGANYFRFDDIVFETTASQTQVIVHVTPTDSNGDNTGSTVNDLPNYIYFSRCWIKGRNSGNIVNGLYLNARAGAFVDGIIENIFFTGVESHSIGVFNGRGPFKIVNNYLDGGSINILFGGSDPFITGFVPEDLEIRRNHFTMRDSWNQFHASYDGVSRAIKNRLEFKYGKRVLVEGNVLEKCPIGGGQNGEAFVVKSMAGENGANFPWYVTQDICIRYNIARELWNVIYCTGVQRPEVETLGGTARVAMLHNLIYNYGDTRYGNTDNAHAGLMGDAVDFQLDHNTMMPRAASLTSYNPRSFFWTADSANGSMPGFRITNGIHHAGRYEANRWTFSNQANDGESEMNRVSGADYLLENSIFVDANAGVFPSGEVIIPASIAAVNFSSDDPSIGLDGDSPAKNAATDGTDLGCNYAKVNLATSGVVV
jgi:hypothetical protein